MILRKRKHYRIVKRYRTYLLQYFDKLCVSQDSSPSSSNVAKYLIGIGLQNAIRKVYFSIFVCYNIDAQPIRNI